MPVWMERRDLLDAGSAFQNRLQAASHSQAPASGGNGARRPSGANPASGPAGNSRASGGFRPPGGRPPGGLMGMMQSVSSEVGSVESLIGQLPVELQSQYSDALQSILGGGNPSDQLDSVRSLGTALTSALQALQQRDGDEADDVDAIAATSGNVGIEMPGGGQAAAAKNAIAAARLPATTAPPRGVLPGGAPASAAAPPLSAPPAFLRTNFRA